MDNGREREKRMMIEKKEGKRKGREWKKKRWKNVNEKNIVKESGKRQGKNGTKMKWERKKGSVGKERKWMVKKRKRKYF